MEHVVRTAHRHAVWKPLHWGEQRYRISSVPWGHAVILPCPQVLTERGGCFCCFLCSLLTVALVSCLCVSVQTVYMLKRFPDLSAFFFQKVTAFTALVGL